MIEPIYGWQTKDGKRLAVITVADFPASPREWADSVIYHWQREIRLGEFTPYLSHADAQEKFSGDVYFPLYLTNNQGWIHLRVGYAANGELVPPEGHVGWIVYPMEHLTCLEKICGVRCIDVLQSNANAEMKDYAAYLNGECYDCCIYAVDECGTCGHASMNSIEMMSGFYSSAQARDDFLESNPGEWIELSDKELRALRLS